MNAQREISEMAQSKEHVRKVLDDMMARVNVHAQSRGLQGVDMPTEDREGHVAFVIQSDLTAEEYVEMIEPAVMQAATEMATQEGFVPPKKH